MLAIQSEKSVPQAFQTCVDGIRLGSAKTDKGLANPLVKVLQSLVVDALDLCHDGLKLVDKRGSVFLQSLDRRQILPCRPNAVCRRWQVSMSLDNLLRFDRVVEQLHQIFRESVISLIFRPPATRLDLVGDRRRTGVITDLARQIIDETVDRFLFEEFSFVTLQGLEIRLDAVRRGVQQSELAQDAGAKTVNGADHGPRELFRPSRPEVALSGIGSERGHFSESGPQTFLQLGGRLAREGDGHDLSQIQRLLIVPALSQKLGDALDQHAGFAATGVGADCQIAARVQRVPLAVIELFEVIGWPHPFALYW